MKEIFLICIGTLMVFFGIFVMIDKTRENQINKINQAGCTYIDASKSEKVYFFDCKGVIILVKSQ